MKFDQLHSNAEALGPAERVIILPVGSTEQHGPHLPLGTDSFLASAIADRVAHMAPKALVPLVLPCLWVSLAEHHMAFPGSLTLTPDTFEAVLAGIVGSLSRQGYRRIAILNGHGGNVRALGAMRERLGATTDLMVRPITYWDVAEPPFGDILETQPNLRHACEAETSMMMAIRPKLVDNSIASLIEAPVEFPEAAFDADGMRPVQEFSPTGVVGSPRAATAAKGERLLDAAAKGVCARLFTASFWAIEQDQLIFGKQ